MHITYIYTRLVIKKMHPRAGVASLSNQKINSLWFEFEEIWHAPNEDKLRHVPNIVPRNALQRSRRSIKYRYYRYHYSSPTIARQQYKFTNPKLVRSSRNSSNEAQFNTRWFYFVVNKLNQAYHRALSNSLIFII